jgi:hypothetical protein
MVVDNVLQILTISKRIWKFKSNVMKKRLLTVKPTVILQGPEGYGRKVKKEKLFL